MSEPSHRPYPVGRKPAPRHPEHLPRVAPTLALALAVGLGVGLTGCAGDGTKGGPFSGFKNPFQGSLKNPFAGPSEAGFLALVRHYCSDLAVGTSTVRQLLQTDKAFQDLTSKLYNGDLSNDEYLNQVNTLHPAADANIPAMGCIVNQSQECFARRCSVAASEQPIPPADQVPEDADQFDPGIDAEPIPAKDKDAVDRMIEEADRERGTPPTPTP